MPEDLSSVLSLDPEESTFLAVFGRKGTGKSFLAQQLAESWPFSMVIIDPTGDIRLPGAVPMPRPVPVAWPDAPKGAPPGPLRLHYVPNRRDPGHREETDHAVGLAYEHGLTLLWVDEVREVAKANRVQPYMDELLHQGRHRRISAIFAGPRPVDIDPLVLTQADWVFIFDMPGVADQERVSSTLGIDKPTLRGLIEELPEHGFLAYQANAHELFVLPPLERKPQSTRS